MTQHTDKLFEEDLSHLKTTILKMGSMVEEMIGISIKALVDRDSTLPDQVLEKDRAVNQLEMDIDAQCLKILALRQPAGSDLRFITIGVRIATDLERLGDLAVNIVRHVRDLNQLPPFPPKIDILPLALNAQTMVKDSLDAFVMQDTEKANEVCLKDDVVDDLNWKLQEELTEFMIQNAKDVPQAIHLVHIAQNLERLADHATNIAEIVIFLVKGEDIRHQHKKK